MRTRSLQEISRWRSYSYGVFIFIYKYFTSGLFAVLSVLSLRANCCFSIFLSVSFRSFNSLYFHFCHAYTFYHAPKVILYFAAFFSSLLSFPLLLAHCSLESQFIIFLYGFRLYFNLLVRLSSHIAVVFVQKSFRFQFQLFYSFDLLICVLVAAIVAIHILNHCKATQVMAHCCRNAIRSFNSTTNPQLTAFITYYIP